MRHRRYGGFFYGHLARLEDDWYRFFIFIPSNQIKRIEAMKSHCPFSIYMNLILINGYKISIITHFDRVSQHGSLFSFQY